MNTLIANRKYTGLAAIVLVLAAGATASTTQAQAQTARARVTVPFDFQTGSEHLPAGDYTVGMDSEHFLRLQSAKTASLALTRAESNSKPATGGKLVFARYGTRYFLREVWMADKAEHQVLPKSKAEKRQLNALNVADRSGVEVAVLEPLR